MPDFGDEAGDFFWRGVLNSGRHYFELAKNKIIQLLKPPKDDPSLGELRALRSEFEQYIANVNETLGQIYQAQIMGAAGNIDLTDGEINSVTIDLGFLGDNPKLEEIATSALREHLHDCGFEDDRLVQVMEPKEIFNPNTNQYDTFPIPTQSHIFTFTDNPEEVAKAKNFLEGYQKKIFEKPEIAEYLEINELNCEVRRFGFLSDTERISFVEKLKDAYLAEGISLDTISISQFEDGNFAGDLSIAYTPSNLKPSEVLERVRQEWAQDHPDSSLNLLLTTEKAAEKAISFDERVSYLELVSTELLANGYDCKCHITEDGSFIIDAASTDNPDGVLACLNNFNIRTHIIEEAKLRHRESFKTIDNKELHKLSAQDRIDRIKEGQELLKQQGVDVVMPDRAMPQVTEPPIVSR